MQHRKDRVRNQHARPRVAHDLRKVFEHTRVETLGRAKTAYRLVLLLARALIDAFHGVLKQTAAISTERRFCMPMSATVNPYHALDRFLFSLGPGSVIWQDHSSTGLRRTERFPPYSTAAH
jgi:hypothetical protein